MSNITLIRNNKIEVTENLKQAGIVFTGKNHGTVREKLLSTELAFKAKFIHDENISGISKLIVIGDDFSEALRFSFIADSQNIPCVCISTMICKSFSKKLLHIIKTDEESLYSCVKAVLAFDKEAKAGYYFVSEAEGEYALQTAFADIIGKLPDNEFSRFFIKIHAHPSENIEKLLQFTKNLPNCNIKRVDTDRLREIKAEIFAFPG
ncbi:MAG: hypothetical protein LBM41_07750 [Ruminococcus sp.]|jgi:hypothetical protein|nr:hypothetical protein [Ruminococcus sp.]